MYSPENLILELKPQPQPALSLYLRIANVWCLWKLIGPRYRKGPTINQSFYRIMPGEYNGPY